MSRSVSAAAQSLDLSLYLVTDYELCGPRGLIATVKLALEGGVTALQYRAKTTEHSVAMVEASALASLAGHYNVPFIINDRLDLALAIGADGLHVGQSDISPTLARRHLGPDKILGLSITAAAELPTIDYAVVDYVGLGPVFATSTKPDAAPPLGLEGFRRLRQAIDLPVVAIGGIGTAEIGAVMATGADGVAVVSAICAATDPATAARDLLARITEVRGTRVERQA